MPEKTFHIHLVSDSTGETVSSIARSVMALFDAVEVEEHTWSLIRTKGQMQRVLDGIEALRGVVLYTLVDAKMEEMLVETCTRLKITAVPVLARTIWEMSSFLGKQPKAAPGKQHAMDDDYFARVEAMNFTLAHDDGQNTSDINEADIVLVGVSRTSKTPTCVYLSYRGYKVVNVPYVMGCPLPEELFTTTKPLVVGLVISPDRLLQIRKSRLLSLNEQRETSYVDMEHILAEIAEARKLFSKQKWPVIDVTRKSVEETAATVLQYLNKRRETAINAGGNHEKNVG